MSPALAGWFFTARATWDAHLPVAFQHSKTKIKALDPITSWQIGGENMKTVTDFIFWGSKITADNDCTREIKRCLLLEEKWQN